MPQSLFAAFLGFQTWSLPSVRSVTNNSRVLQLMSIQFFGSKYLFSYLKVRNASILNRKYGLQGLATPQVAIILVGYFDIPVFYMANVACLRLNSLMSVYFACGFSSGPAFS